MGAADLLPYPRYVEHLRALIRNEMSAEPRAMTTPAPTQGAEVGPEPMETRRGNPCKPASLSPFAGPIHPAVAAADDRVDQGLSSQGPFSGGPNESPCPGEVVRRPPD